MTAAPSSPTPAYRCSAASIGAGESPVGTASTIRAFVLMECSGPWGVDAVTDCRLPDEVKQRLDRLGDLGIRPLLIRRRHLRERGQRLFAVYAGNPLGAIPAPPALHTAVLDDPRELLDLDLSGLRDGGAPVGLRPTDAPLFGVCTHGRHDACCAERGRPLAAALAAVAPEQTWEVSHMGGDRFAPNVLVLPHGLYYGRVPVAEAESFVRAALAGRLHLAHLRGRSTYPFPVQAAEAELRRRLGDDRITAYPVLEHDRTRDAESSLSRVVFDVDGTSWQAHVRTSAAAPARLTCKALGDSRPPEHHVTALQALTGPAT